MLLDFSEAWPRLADHEYDVCICGTGPAGITLARKLAALRKRVLLLEGGGLEFTEESQELYAGKSVGRQYWRGVQDNRLRYFGGTSNHWTGRCGIFDQIDFETRQYFGDLGGWPISRDEVIAHLDEAKDILDIADANLGAQQSPLKGFAISGFALSPPTRFAEKYVDELRKSTYIDCLYNANLTEITGDEAFNRVKSLVLTSFSRQKAAAKAKAYVLALGAIENARLLLATARNGFAGIGNQGDMVGRCFMEHLNVPIGRFIVTKPSFWQTGMQLVPLPSLMEEFRIGNGIVDFGPNSSPQSYGRLKALKQFLRETGCSLRVRDLIRELGDFNCPGDGLITSLIEQVPNRDSRILLSTDKDEFGLRRVELNWNLNEEDFRTVRSLAMLSAQEMARADLARVKLAPFILEKEGDIVVDGHAHQMGTTRMSVDSSKGVVDGNCKVHGVDNMYVAGSSVFATGGGTNPTLTIVLLALRLAIHLDATT